MTKRKRKKTKSVRRTRLRRNPKTPFLRGYDAAIKGKHNSSNPFTGASRADYERGWQKGNAERFRKLPKSAKRRRTLPPIPKRRAKNVRITRAKRNPYIPYLIYGDARPHRAKAGRVSRYYWTGYKFTTDKKYAEHFPNAESAFNVCKRIRNRLPNALEFVAVQEVK